MRNSSSWARSWVMRGAAARIVGTRVSGSGGRAIARGAADEELELVGEELGDAGDVGAHRGDAGQRDRGPDDRHVTVVVVGVVDADGEQRSAGAQRQRRRTGRQRGALAEELDLDAVAL